MFNKNYHWKQLKNTSTICTSLITDFFRGEHFYPKGVKISQAESTGGVHFAWAKSTGDYFFRGVLLSCYTHRVFYSVFNRLSRAKKKVNATLTTDVMKQVVVTLKVHIFLSFLKK